MAFLDSTDRPVESRQHNQQSGDTTVPQHISQFLSSAIVQMQADPGVLGLAVGGSWLGANDANGTQSMDESSDLDLFIMGTDAWIADPFRQDALARSIGSLCLAHRMKPQGHPNWIVCLYNPPLIRVDLNLVTPEHLSIRYEDPAILWERDRAVSCVLSSTAPSASANLWQQPTLEWMDLKFWPAVHRNALQVAHGELLEAINGLEDLRAKVLAPLAAIVNGRDCRGVRHFETRFPARVAAFSETVAAYDADSCRKSLAATIELYRQLRSSLGVALAAGPEEAAIGAISNFDTAV